MSGSPGPSAVEGGQTSATQAAPKPDSGEEPTKVFDNLYVIGRTSTAVWAVTTSAGIVLIDAGYGDQLESVLLPGMKALGLDPAQVKYVIVGHGHGDHFGGSAYFQQRGARVAMAGPDWDLVETPPPAGRGAAAVQPPKRDIVAVEGRHLSGEGRPHNAHRGTVRREYPDARSYLGRWPSAVHQLGGALGRCHSTDESRGRDSEPPDV